MISAAYFKNGSGHCVDQEEKWKDNLETSVAIHTIRQPLFMVTPSALDLLSNVSSRSSSVLWSLRTAGHHSYNLTQTYRQVAFTYHSSF